MPWVTEPATHSLYFPAVPIEPEQSSELAQAGVAGKATTASPVPPTAVIVMPASRPAEAVRRQPADSAERPSVSFA